MKERSLWGGVHFTIDEGNQIEILISNNLLTWFSILESKFKEKWLHKKLDGAWKITIQNDNSFKKEPYGIGV